MNINFLPHFKPLFQQHRYYVCLSGRCSGKSFHIAVVLLYLASRAKMRILCVREFQNSIAESSMAQLLQIIDLSDTRSAWTVTKTELVHNITGSRFLFRGIKTDPTSIKSITNIDCCWAEEADGLSQESLNILIPSIRKNNSRIYFSGNPKDRMSALSQMFIENTPPPDTIIISNDYRDNPYVSATMLAEAKHMEESNIEMYRYVYLGEYLDASNLILVKNSVRGKTALLGSDKCIVGVDIARDGGDRTVICVRKGKQVAELLAFPTMDLDKLTHELNSIIHRHKPEQINVDSTGHGAWLPDALKSTGIIVKAISFGANANKEDRYTNMRSELYGLASEYFQKGGFIRQNDIDLERELSASYYTLDNKNRIKLIPKEEIKKRIGRSPDLADAFCLSLVCTGDMFMSTKRAEAIKSINLGKELAESGSW